MKRIIALLIVCIIVVMLSGCCGQVQKAKEMVESTTDAVKAAEKLSEEMEKVKNKDGEFELTRARINRFIEEYPIFQRIVEEKNKTAEGIKDDTKAGIMAIQTLAELNETMRKEGISNPAEFYLTMGEVWLGVTYLITKETAEQMKAQMEENIVQLKEQLNDPKLPADYKEALKQSIASAESAQTQEFELPKEITESELKLIADSFDELKRVLGMEEQPEKVTDAEPPIEETE